MTSLRRLLVLGTAVLLACKSAPQPAASAATAPAAAAAAAQPVPAPTPVDAPKPETVAADTPRTTAAGHTFTQPANWTMYSSGEHRIVVAGARKKGDGWCVTLLDGSEAAAERRGSQLGLVVGSLRPAGYARESFVGKTAHPLDAARVKTITEFVDAARKAADVPGVAIGLIDHGKVVFAGGLGVREQGKKESIDANTLFLIASNSKALTTLLLSKEVDRKKFTWNTPVTEVYPEFKLGSAEVTKQVLMKHLVCACTGMPRQDLEWLFDFKDATPASALKMLGTFVPTSKFGEVFQYSNLMAAAAGFVGGHVFAPKLELGRAYDEAMRKEIFTPLGMKMTTFDFKRALAGNHASPHGADIDGNIQLARMDLNYAIVPARPAGGAWSAASS
jgi:CubicO group peptidase (beta-lactamase class C family)